jgi:hypothetical protein
VVKASAQCLHWLIQRLVKQQSAAISTQNLSDAAFTSPITSLLKQQEARNIEATIDATSSNVAKSKEAACWVYSWLQHNHNHCFCLTTTNIIKQ